MEWTGGCLCGAIRYRSDQPPNQVYACHCRMCQRHTGSAFWFGAKFPRNALQFTKGEPQLYQSSKILERFFCSDCGSSVALFYPNRPWPGEEPGIEVAAGTLDHPELLEPEFHYGVESKLSWLHFDESIRQERCDEDADLQGAHAKAEKN